MIDVLLIFLLLAVGTWFAAALGAAMIVFVKGGKSTNLIMGFAAGVILMVSFTELLHPAIHKAEHFSSLPAWIVVPVAFAAGFVCVLLLDRHIDKLKKKRGAEGKADFKHRQGLLLIGAFSTHSIPEGLALGILLGAIGSTFSVESFWVVIPLVIAVGVHKIPEGTAISVTFQREGLSKLKSFFVGQASGVFAFLSGIAGFFIAISIDAILPYAMGFAGGAMVWVAVHELIPKSIEKEKTSKATIGILLGVVLMLIIDTTLHNHSIGNFHCCGPITINQRF